LTTAPGEVKPTLMAMANDVGDWLTMSSVQPKQNHVKMVCAT
jgi:hypothetical protein